MLMRKRSSMAVSSSSNSSNPSNHASHFFTDRKPRASWHRADSRPVGLGIVDALRNDSPETDMKLGSQLKIQIPSLHNNSISSAAWTEFLSSPIEFGVKNKNSQLALLSPALRSPMACSTVVAPPPVSDMELSEDYTCVIAHGPTPRIIHIFDNCIVDSCGNGHRYFPSPREMLALCHSCKKSLGQGKDNLMDRGQKAFCSWECQNKEMVFDEGMASGSGSH